MTVGAEWMWDAKDKSSHILTFSRVSVKPRRVRPTGLPAAAAIKLRLTLKSLQSGENNGARAMVPQVPTQINRFKRLSSKKCLLHG